VRSADRIAGAALLALGVGFSAGALTHYAYWGENGPGPAFLPFWLGLALAGLASILLIGAMRASAPGDPWLPRGEGLRRLVLVLVITVAFVALLKVLGMALGTVLFLVALLRGIDRQPWRVTISVALAVAAANYLVFAHWLKVPMPVGLLGF
jgi:putative tricarboxylic transport membrane protein